MKARILNTGLYVLLCSRVFGAEDIKLPFTCTPDDLQWAGMTCPENEPCAVFLELSSVSSGGGKVFVAGDIHSAQTTLYSVLLRSDDSGATWQEPVGRVRGEVLDHIQFENFEAGWVSGQRVIPLPGDPFLLITHDGGKNWRKAPVLPEGSPGFIQKFRFDSATSGRLVIDRGKSAEENPEYRLFETKDGAESWTSVEASTQPIKNAPVQEESDLWRLIPDKGGKKLVLEHRAADKWVAATTFVIQVGECREQ
jgi:Sortilin, neurotensin receptor 3,